MDEDATAQRGDAPESPVKRSPALLRLFAAIAAAIGFAGLIATAVAAYRCFGYDPATDTIARLTRDHATVRLWLQILLPLSALSFAVFAAAGLGLFRARRWALNLIIGQAIAGLAGILLGAIIVFSHFRGVLVTPTGYTKANFSVALSHVSKTPVTVDYQTLAELAAPGIDFVPTNGTLTIPAGKLSGSITVNVIGDSEQEPTKTFSLTLTNAVNATITSAAATATIHDDDGLPTLSIADDTVRERNYGQIDAVFAVELSHAVDHPIYVDFATADATATAGADYRGTNGTLVIPAWQRRAKLVVPVEGDTETESPVETFTITLFNPQHALLGPVSSATGHICDNEGIPFVTLSDAKVTETDRDSVNAAFLVTMSRPFPTPVDLTYTTTNLTARSPKDYTAVSGKIRFRPRLTNVVVNVEVNPDYTAEGHSETFGLHLTMLGDDATLLDGDAIGTIIDDDSTPTLSIKDVTVTEGNPANEPVAAAMATMRHVGTLFGAILLLIAPIGVLVFGSRKPVLYALKIDPESPTFTAGTLVYTKLGLTALFAWLLWGEFCWTIMEAVVPSVLPFKLKALGASNTLMVIILNTLPSILNLTICPWVSFKSDRYRSRWGRRIPFILWTMPFLTISLILLGASEPLAAWIREVVPAAQAVAPNTMAVIVIAVLMVVFQFFNMFVNSVFWYLFNDVVPPQFLGRFMGLFRLVGTAAGAIYNAFIFGYAETHMQEILSGAALLYFVGFGVVCLRVKEGEYPPITGEETGRRKGLLSDIKLFGKESFSVRFYWYLYLTGAFSRIAYALAIFGVFMSKEMGLTVAQMGKLAAVGSIAGILATYFTAVLVDRWHPMRITVYEKIFTAVGGYGGWIWLYVTLPGDLYFWLSLGGAIVMMFNYQLTDAAGIPLMMRILPKSRYGQFSSAAAMIRSLGMIVGGILAGLYMDLLRWLCGGSDFAYRLIFTWVWPFSILTTILYVLVYQEWKRYGGDVHYRPPAPWSPDGFEEVVDKVKSAPLRPRAVTFALNLGLVAAILNILIVLVFMIYMHQHGMARAMWWYGWILVPVKVLITAMTYWQIVSVKRDISDVEAGRTPRYGVPHHGVFLVQAITGLIYFPVYWMQTLWMIKIDYEIELILFGINTLLGGFAGIAALQLIRWIERVQPTIPPASQTSALPAPPPQTAPQAA